MALVNCRECGHQVSSKATKCPSCGAFIKNPRRGFFGFIFKWAFVLFNILMLIWIFSYFSQIDEVVKIAESDAARAGAGFGAGIGTMFLLLIWALGAVILGIATLLTKPRT